MNIVDAVDERDIEFVEFLLRAGKSVDAVDVRRGSLPLIIAVQSDNVDMVKLLLRHGARPRDRDAFQCTAFDALNRHSMHYDRLHMMLTEGPDADLVDPQRSAFSMANVESHGRR